MRSGVISRITAVGIRTQRRYCNESSKEITEAIPTTKPPLTVNPETAHAHITEKYDMYQKHMREVFVPERSSRRKTLRDQLPKAELARRTVEYGIYGSSLLSPINKDHRWQGLMQDIRAPKRHRTFRSRAARGVSNSLSILFGLSVAYYFTLDPEAGVNIEDMKDRFHPFYYIPGFNFWFGTDYGQGLLINGSGYPPFNSPDILLDGEPPDEGPKPRMFRFTFYEEWYENDEYLKRKPKGDYDE